MENNVQTNKISIISLGCKVNQCEAEQLAQLFFSNGFDVKFGFVVADIYILNTCAVTSEAESKSRQTISKLNKLNKNCSIFVCGCASQLDAQQFAILPNVTYISGTFGKEQLLDAVKNQQTKISIQPFSTQYKDICFTKVNRIRQFLKIQDGCNNFCSYCIVPYLRGRSRSCSVQDVLASVQRLEQYAAEIVLSGIDISSYGKDIDSSLTQLLVQLRDIKVRLRISSLEVNCITNEFLQAAKDCKNFCPHFHLSLQSGSDNVLKKMNRKYTTAKYKDAVNLIRSVFPNASITTDLIVGFPTETEEDFFATLQFCKDMQFADIHCFNYSVREGTVAASLLQLSGEVKALRMKELTELKAKAKLLWAQTQIGKICNVLVESVKNLQGFGYSENYTAIRFFASLTTKNKIVKVKITSIDQDGMLKGEILND